MAPYSGGMVHQLPPRPEAATVADALCDFIDASPSPFHAVATGAAMLAAAGFVELQEADAWPTMPTPQTPNAPGPPARAFVRREGSLVAWSIEAASAPHAPFRIVGTHSDSPNLRLKPRPDQRRYGWDLLGVEVYGGPLLNSWLDRDLGLSGRISVRGPAGPQMHLVRIDSPLLRVAQLAVHLDRNVNEDGVRLNPQTQLVPIWGVGPHPADLPAFLAEQVGCAAGDILAWDLMTHDLTPSTRLGRNQDLLAAPRLDNLCSTFAALTALIEITLGADELIAHGTHPAPPSADPGYVSVVAVFDHEEIGSMTNRGADSSLLPTILERIVCTGGGDRQDYLRALAGTLVVSADMAHAVHPNYPERSDPEHAVLVNAGPVLKVNNRGRYATDASGAAYVQLACEQAGVQLQEFVSRSDMPCGSTIGPMTAARLGAVTVDVGAPMLSMHSARELCGANDPTAYLAMLRALLAPTA